MQKPGRCKHDLELVTTRLSINACQSLGIASDAEYTQGFQNLYTLEKGVQNYMKEKGTDLWKGSLFVFDGRMAVRPGAPHTPCNYDCSRFEIYCMCCTRLGRPCDCPGQHRCPRPTWTLGRSFIKNKNMQSCLCGSISVGNVMLLRLWKQFSCTKDLHQ